jgi:streptogramin lyase
MLLSEILSRIGATRIAVFLMFCTVAPILGQDTNSDQLRALLKSVPQLPVERIDVKVNPPMMFEGISAVTTDKRGNIYVIHRPADGDPIVVLDPQGNFIRSWGKGMFKIPHGIRIDPAGNVWTVDANTSMVYKFTPEGKKLLEIAVGDVPDKTKDFCGATDIAFAKSGHVFVSDGYCNARVVEYDAAGKKLR